MFKICPWPAMVLALVSCTFASAMPPKNKKRRLAPPPAAGAVISPTSGGLLGSGSGHVTPATAIEERSASGSSSSSTSSRPPDPGSPAACASASSAPPATRTPAITVEDLLVEAYRLDFADPVDPIELGVNETAQVAEHFEVRVDWYECDAERPGDGGLILIQQTDCLNDGAEGDAEGRILLSDGGDMVLLEPVEEEKSAEFKGTDARGCARTYRTVGGDLQGLGPNQAIHLVSLMANGRIALPEEIGALRGMLAEDLTRDEILDEIMTLKDALEAHPGAYITPDGRVPGFGSRFGPMLLLDPAVKEAWKRHLGGLPLPPTPKDLVASLKASLQRRQMEAKEDDLRDCDLAAEFGKVRVEERKGSSAAAAAAAPSTARPEGKDVKRSTR